MAIPQGLTIDDVRAAAARIDTGETGGLGKPIEYLAVIGGKQYPMEALIGKGRTVVIV